MIEIASAVLSESLVRLLRATVSNDKGSDSNTGLPALREEEGRQEIAMRMAERQAKVAQEIAIARKIELAHEVEIEEFYDTSGEGSIGGKSDGSGITLGVSGRANRVVRRVYKFKGRESQNVGEPIPSSSTLTTDFDGSDA